MKKYLLILITFFTFSAASAQVYGDALGVRFGYGGGVSYQLQLNKMNRIEGDLGIGLGSSYSYYRFTVIYHWVFDVGTGWNLYLGPALTVGNLFFKDDYLGKAKDGIFLSAGAQAGIEYNLQNLPFHISLDLMPQFAVLNGFDDVNVDPAFAVRWVF